MIQKAPTTVGCIFAIRICAMVRKACHGMERFTESFALVEQTRWSVCLEKRFLDEIERQVKEFSNATNEIDVPILRMSAIPTSHPTRINVLNADLT